MSQPPPPIDVSIGSGDFSQLIHVHNTHRHDTQTCTRRATFVATGRFFFGLLLAAFRYTAKQQQVMGDTHCLRCSSTFRMRMANK